MFKMDKNNTQTKTMSILSSDNSLQESFNMSMVKDFVRKIVKNPIKAAIAAVLIANILKSKK
jgi:hypothetical protein